MIKASIIGITGYTGLECLRLLLAHPHVEIAQVTGREDAGKAIGDLYPHLAHMDLGVSAYDAQSIIDTSDVVFVALPHMAAQDIVAALHGKVKVVDLSADYRLDDVAIYEKYYQEHKHPALLSEVVYGAPEFHREVIKGADSVANPGCFALLAQIMLYPFAGAIERADIMAITGSSGSGKSASEGTHHPVRSHNMKSYNINAHRHIPEITRTAQIDETQMNFVPTSGPFVRGIFATAFVKTDAAPKDVYGDAPFVRVTDCVALANIVGSNFCDVSFTKTEGGYIVQGALDNLVKGAAGCAVQNMNLMFGLDEGEGLMNLGAIYP
ncbi:MAG: N-acetyl-gamma-glutamyl-phosphate reductase [Alphaproteobacteria bacterium]